MNRKQALLIGAFSAVALGYVGASHLIGGRIETAFNDAVSRATGKFSGRLVSYQRGLFSSTARTEWRLDAPDAPPLFIFEHDIRHGPTWRGDMARIETRLPTPEALRAELDPLFKGQPLLRIDSDLSFSGDSHNRLSSPAVSGQIDGLTLDWGGLGGEITMTAGSNRAHGTLHAPALKFSEAGDGQTLQFEGLSLNMDQALAPNLHFYIGAFEMRLDKLRAHNGSERVEADGLVLRSDAQLDSQLVSLGVALDSARLEAAGETLGNAGMSLRLNRLDTAAFDNLSQAAERARQSGGEIEQQQAMLAGAALEQLPKLLSQQPEIELRRLGATTPQGPVNLALRLRYVGKGQWLTFDPERDLEGELQLAAPVALVERLAADSARQSVQAQAEALEMEVPDETIERLTEKRVGELQQNLAQSRLFRRVGDSWQAAMTLKDGQLSAHGEALAADELGLIGKLLQH